MYKLVKQLQNYSLENISNIGEKTVILRSCLNVAVNESGKVTDPTRINESIPTIKYLADNAKRVVIVGHLGRPNSYSHELSFWNVKEHLESSLGLSYDVQFVPFGSNEEYTSKIVLLDNIRFSQDEENKDLDKRMKFAIKLAEQGDVFVNDSFADYRESASTFDIAKVLPSYLGYKFIQEVEKLSQLANPKRPYVAVLGGAKLSEKLDVLNALSEQADKIIIGGAMAYTLLKAKGVNIGNSMVEEDKIEVARAIVAKYEDKLILPTDHLISDEFSEYSSYEYTTSAEVPEDKVAIDIGWDSIRRFTETISSAETILWNGPMGVFEWTHSSVGTKEIGDSIQKSTAYKLVGGGDTIAAIHKFNLEGFDHICTGGGAMLAFIANDEFPTLDVILNKQ